MITKKLFSSIFIIIFVVIVGIFFYSKDNKITTLDFIADKISTTPGEAVILTLVAKNANFCNLNADGQKINWQSSNLFKKIFTSNLNYTVTVSPLKTTIYTATCYNSPSKGEDGSGSGSMVVVTTTPSTPPTVDLKINNSDGPITIRKGEGISGNWTTSGVGACKLLLSGKVLNGVEEGIGSFGDTLYPDHSFYPTSFPNTFTLTCTTIIQTSPYYKEGGDVSDSVIINLTK